MPDATPPLPPAEPPRDQVSPRHGEPAEADAVGRGALAEAVSALADGLVLHRLGVALRCASPLALHDDFPGFTLYGALKTSAGHRACALRPPRCADSCLHPEGCLFAALFQGGGLNTPPALVPSGFQQPPQPVWLHAGRVPAFADADARIRFEVRLVAPRWTPLVVGAVRGWERFGLGLGSVRGRVVVESIDLIGQTALTPLLVEDSYVRAGGRSVAPPPVPTLGALLRAERSGPPAPTGGVLRLVTPVRLASRKQVVPASALTLADLVQAALRRARLLRRFYGSGPAPLTGPLDDVLAEEARAVPVDTVLEDRVYWRNGKRYQGVDGTLQFGAVTDGLRAALRLGELLHVGSRTTHGFGELRLETVPSAEQDASLE